MVQSQGQDTSLLPGCEHSGLRGSPGSPPSQRGRPSLSGRAGLSPASPQSHARGTMNAGTGYSYVSLGVWVAGAPPELGET